MTEATDLGGFDIIVIGGGINGAGIARDAAGRGLKVLLCEKDDLAQGTSSRSGKLIHGGLRYLEYYEFRLVREALIEREVLLRSAPHIVWPMRFVITHSPEQRPAWLIRLGLFLYDHLGGREKLPACRRIDLKNNPEGRALKDSYKLAFEYSDCWVDDARLVVLNAVDAHDRGATVLTRTEATGATRIDNKWTVSLKNSKGEILEAHAQALVNAAGPWVEKVIGAAGVKSTRRVRLVKGSHIIVKKFWEGPQAYVFQHTDKRVIFVNPYEGDMALIGTTDIPYSGRAEDVAITDDEADYLLGAVNRYSRTQLTRDDILHRYSGVRPLYDDNADNPSAVTRDYVFEVDGSPPILSVFGGKITTYRKLSEHGLEKLAPYFPNMKGPWTSKVALPGGEIANGDFDGFLEAMRKQWPWLPRDLAYHYARLYGTRVERLLRGIGDIAGLGQKFGPLLYQAEIDFVRSKEWAVTSDDVLYRRTKHGLHMNEAERAAVAKAMGSD